MRRSRGSGNRGPELPQRQSPRGPHTLRTSSSSDSDHRSPKVGDRRSPRGTPQSNPLNQKKLGTRIADLESQLGQAQVELKSLKEQLTSAEAAKKEAQEQLEKKSKKPTIPLQTVGDPGKDSPTDEVVDENQQETDVFEVPVEKVTIEEKVDFNQLISDEEKETKPIKISTELPAVSVADDLSVMKEEINTLKVKLEQKEKEIEVFGQDSESLKNQLNAAASKTLSAETKNEEMTQSLSRVEEELKLSKEERIKLKEKVEAMKGENELLEAEMKKMKVQTEQWRKAADAAAAVLSGGLDINASMPGRCGSMDKHFGGIFDPSSGGGYTGFGESPDNLDDGFGSGKKKGSGIKRLGDLWKKKGQK